MNKIKRKETATTNLLLGLFIIGFALYFTINAFLHGAISFLGILGMIVGGRFLIKAIRYYREIKNEK